MRVVLLLLIVFIAGCGTPCVAPPPPPNEQSLVNEVRNKTFAQLKEEKELYPYGIGSEMMYQIKMLALGFRYYKEVNIAQARELLIRAGTVFLDTINSNEQIRQFLHNYPFKPENIEISIYLQKPDGSNPDPDKLTVITITNGVLDYMIDEPGTYRLLTIYKETFEEATEKLNTDEGIAALKTL